MRRIGDFQPCEAVPKPSGDRILAMDGLSRLSADTEITMVLTSGDIATSQWRTTWAWAWLCGVVTWCALNLRWNAERRHWNRDWKFHQSDDVAMLDSILKPFVALRALMISWEMAMQSAKRICVVEDNGACKYCRIKKGAGFQNS